MVIMTCAIRVQAQHSHLSKEEFRERQQAFITEKAQLSAKEAQQFFPLYFELQDKKRECNKAAWQKQRKGKEENTTEEEYAQIVEDVIQARIDVDRLDLEYVLWNTYVNTSVFSRLKRFTSSRKPRCVSTGSC